MAASNDDVLLKMAERLGQILGTQMATQTELSRLNAELIRMAAEVDAKHKENLDMIGKFHAENISVITTHKDEDNDNFSELRGKLNKIFYTFAGVSGTALVLWALFKAFMEFSK